MHLSGDLQLARAFVFSNHDSYNKTRRSPSGDKCTTAVELRSNATIDKQTQAINSPIAARKSANRICKLQASEARLKSERLATSERPYFSCVPWAMFAILLVAALLVACQASDELTAEQATVDKQAANNHAFLHSARDTTFKKAHSNIGQPNARYLYKQETETQEEEQKEENTTNEKQSIKTKKHKCSKAHRKCKLSHKSSRGKVCGFIRTPTDVESGESDNKNNNNKSLIFESICDFLYKRCSLENSATKLKLASIDECFNNETSENRQTSKQQTQNSNADETNKNFVALSMQERTKFKRLRHKESRRCSKQEFTQLKLNLESKFNFDNAALFKALDANNDSVIEARELLLSDASLEYPKANSTSCSLLHLMLFDLQPGQSFTPDSFEVAFRFVGIKSRNGPNNMRELVTNSNKERIKKKKHGTYVRLILGQSADLGTCLNKQLLVETRESLEASELVAQSTGSTLSCEWSRLGVKLSALRLNNNQLIASPVEEELTLGSKSVLVKDAHVRLVDVQTYFSGSYECHCELALSRGKDRTIIVEREFAVQVVGK